MRSHNKALHRTEIPLRSIAAGGLGRYLLAIAAGTIVSAIALGTLKRPLTAAAVG